MIETVLVPDFIEVHAQSLAALQAYCPWLAHFQLYSQLPNSSQNSEAFFQAVRSSVELSVSLFQKDTPHRVSHECQNVESRFRIRCALALFPSTEPRSHRLDNCYRFPYFWRSGVAGLRPPPSDVDVDRPTSVSRQHRRLPVSLHSTRKRRIGPSAENHIFSDFPISL